MRRSDGHATPPRGAQASLRTRQLELELRHRNWSPKDLLNELSRRQWKGTIADVERALRTGEADLTLTILIAQVFHSTVEELTRLRSTASPLPVDRGHHLSHFRGRE